MSKQKPFEHNEDFERLLRERAEDKTRYEMNNSLNTKKAVEAYATAKEKAKK